MTNRILMIDGLNLVNLCSNMDIEYIVNQCRKVLYVPVYTELYMNDSERAVVDDIDAQAKACANRIITMCDAEFLGFKKALVSTVIRNASDTLARM